MTVKISPILILILCLVLIAAVSTGCNPTNEVTEINFSTMPVSRFSSPDQDKSKLVLALSGSLADGFEESYEKGSDHINPLLQFKIGGLNNLLRYLRVFNNKLANEGLAIGHGPLIGQTGTWSDLKSKLALAGKLPFDLLTITDREILTSWIGTNDYTAIWNVSNIHLSNIFDSQSLIPNEKQGLGVMINRNRKDIFISSLISLEATDDSFRSKQKNFYLENPTLNFLKAWQQVRKAKRPDLSIVLFTGKPECNFGHAGKDITFDQLATDHTSCNSNSELVEFINRAPPNSIDLVVISGDSPGVGKIGSVPIVQVDRRNRYLSFVEFLFDGNNKVSVNATTFFSPLKLCSRFHAKFDHCDIIPMTQENTPWAEERKADPGRQAVFLDQKIPEDYNELDSLITSR
jgi:hypothetical protein